MTVKKITALALAGLTAFSLTACSGSKDSTTTASGDKSQSSSKKDSSKGSADAKGSVDATPASAEHPVTIKLGTTDVGGTALDVFKDEAKKNHINVEIVPFSDYTTPNKALSEKQIDVNKFQHLKFLSEYNVGSGDNLVPVGATEIVPLALFWKGHKDLTGIEGKSVAIPSDATNQGRAINVLVQAKLLKLKKDGILTPTPADIDEANSKVKVTPVEATQTTVAYGQGDPAIINNTFLDRAGIDPKDSIFADDPASPEAAPYINAFVSRPEDAKNPNLLKLVEIWHLPDVQAANAKDSKGTSVSVTRSGDDLQKILTDLEQKKKAENSQ